jgi:hypothetical protein
MLDLLHILTEQLVSSLNKMYPDINIYARGHSLRHCSELRKLGASGVVSENIEASLELARMVLINIQINEKKQKAILEDFRRKYHAGIEDLIGNA